MKILENLKKFFGNKIVNFTLKIILLLILFFSFNIKNIITKKYNLTKKPNPEFIENNIQETDKYSEKIQSLEDDLLEFKNIIFELKEEVNSLKNSFIKLQNQNPVVNLGNIKIIILISKLQNKIKNNENVEIDFINYKKDLKILKMLTKDNEELYDLILQLEEILGTYYYNSLNNKNILSIFKIELNNILKNESTNSKNKIKKLFDENLTIRKIDNFSTEEENSTDYKLYLIENSIKQNNFELSVLLIKQNNFEQNFTNSLKLLEMQNNINAIFDEIINIIYKN